MLNLKEMIISIKYLDYIKVYLKDLTNCKSFIFLIKVLILMKKSLLPQIYYI